MNGPVPAPFVAQRGRGRAVLDDERVLVRDQERQLGHRLRGGELHPVGAVRRDPAPLQERHLRQALGAGLGIEHATERVDDVSRGERLPVPELHALAELERPDGAGRVALPRRRELGQHLPVVVLGGEAVVARVDVERALARWLLRRVHRVLVAARLDAGVLHALRRVGAAAGALLAELADPTGPTAAAVTTASARGSRTFRGFFMRFDPFRGVSPGRLGLGTAVVLCTGRDERLRVMLGAEQGRTARRTLRERALERTNLRFTKRRQPYRLERARVDGRSVFQCAPAPPAPTGKEQTLSPAQARRSPASRSSPSSRRR